MQIIDEMTDYGTEEPDYFNGPLDYVRTSSRVRTSVLFCWLDVIEPY